MKKHHAYRYAGILIAVSSSYSFAGGGGAAPPAERGAPTGGHGKPGTSTAAPGAKPSKPAGKVQRDDHKAIALLRAGNERYVEGKLLHPHADAERRHDQAVRGQNPLAAVITCSDSRIPVEMVFDQGVGDLFVVRVAGNVVGGDETGSVEYAVGHLGTPLVVVMGHTSCGAVTAAAKGAAKSEHGSIPELLRHIEPAVARVKEKQPDLEGEKLVAAAIQENVWQSVADALAHSDLLANKARKGEITVVGAVYDIDSGRVEWLGKHPDERQILENVGSKSGDGHGQPVQAQSVEGGHDVEPHKP